MREPQQRLQLTVAAVFVGGRGDAGDHQRVEAIGRVEREPHGGLTAEE